jgi:hypothetical protein
MAAINDKLRIFEDTFNAEKYSDVDYLSIGKLANSQFLSAAVVQLYGQRSDRFPLMLSTKGKGSIKKVESVDTLFKVPIMGKPKKSSAIVKTLYSASDKIGAGKADFTVYFADKFFKKGLTLSTKSGVLVTVQTDPEKAVEGNYYKYTLKVDGSDVNKYVPYSDVAQGARMSAMFTHVGLKDSRGNESRSQAPSQMVNQCSTLRSSYNWKGNLANKVMAIELPTKSGGKTTLWQEWEMFEHDLRFAEEEENTLWYSEFNRTAEGLILDRDVNTGDIVVRGSGLLEQIPNSSSYGVLTENILKRTIRNVLYNSAADVKRSISVYTGVGGKEAFSQALFSSLKSLGFGFQADQFVSGGKNSHAYGAYFGTYIHQDGHTITLKYLPLLDLGAKAEAADKHPISGLPITSYDMYFVDESVINGEPNIQYVQEKGVEEVRALQNGMNKVVNGMVTSDATRTSVHYMKSCGIHMFNPVNSFKLTCNLS